MPGASAELVLVSNTINGELTGDLYLGDVGGTIGLISGGPSEGILMLRGKVSGGTLELCRRWHGDD